MGTPVSALRTPKAPVQVISPPRTTAMDRPGTSAASMSRGISASSVSARVGSGGGGSAQKLSSSTRHIIPVKGLRFIPGLLVQVFVFSLHITRRDKYGCRIDDGHGLMPVSEAAGPARILAFAALPTKPMIFLEMG
jgi:hypothetical protein